MKGVSLPGSTSGQLTKPFALWLNSAWRPDFEIEARAMESIPLAMLLAYLALAIMVMHWVRAAH